jgi:hypothetical protein
MKFTRYVAIIAVMYIFLFSNAHANPDSPDSPVSPAKPTKPKKLVKKPIKRENGSSVIEKLIKGAKEKMTSANFRQKINGLLKSFTQSRFLKLILNDVVKNRAINYGKKLIETKLQGDNIKIASDLFTNGVNTLCDTSNFRKIKVNLDKFFKSITNTNFQQKIKTITPILKKSFSKLLQNQNIQKLTINYGTKLINFKIKDESNRKIAIDILKAGLNSILPQKSYYYR